MSSFYQKPLTRRSAIAGALAALPMLRLGEVQANQYEPIQPVDLGHGLEVRDYRLFPTDDVMRFIVEIHNTTDTAVDTPSVGVVLGQFSDDQNFGWATPIGGVIQPGTSEMLIGVAPTAVRSDDDWRGPVWMLCDEIETSKTESIAQWDIEFTHKLETVNPAHARVHFEVRNNGNRRAMGVVIQGTVRDAIGRVCGAVLPSSVQLIQPGESDKMLVNIIPAAKYMATPFVLIDSVEGISTSFSLQPGMPTLSTGCSPIMPWNRKESE